MNEMNKARNFYSLMCWAGFLLILLPVGIANFVFGYILGDSPCTLCWAQRQSMIFIGVIAFFIVRYGLNGKYLATLLVMTAFGLYQSFAHYGNHAHRDLDQGFSLQVFGIHTYFWAEVVFWAVIVLLGIIFLFAPKFSTFEEEMKGKKVREMTKFTFIAFGISAFIIASNVFQAFVATGVPPYTGQGDPVRFTLNPKYIIWSTDGWKGTWQNISFLGKRDVKSPDYAFAPNGANLGIQFESDSANSPFKTIDRSLVLTQTQKIEYPYPINSMRYINGEWVVSSKWIVSFLDNSFAIKGEFEIDPYFSATIDPIIGVIPYMEDKYLLMGSNKTFLRFKKNDEADDALQFAHFVRGYDRFEGQGDGLGRGRIDTVRSKFHHVASITNDDAYFYMATVPNNKDKKTFVISKFSLYDRILSGEFTPKANLKENRSLGDLYITSMMYHDGRIYALSKNYNVIVVIDIKSEEVVEVMSYPKEIQNARAIYFDGEKIQLVSYQNNTNFLYSVE
ncbi:disulfide bond formation protein B [Helicobacter monodelphidis]|uniref:disulfide bond formation protein DsbI n=1 Tax=Helicobacter sp. 15-1451 TaxID=2004995 RepID=UPI000DCB7A7C|nr:disulfide bond formation protein B [Helicobacter sp. 15-1451]RAX58664.1 disulfide bond formation protein B [Helicobacter sp. 15-1451]